MGKVYEQLYAYLEEHGMLYKHQSGFRAIYSTVTDRLLGIEKSGRLMQLFF